jgi:adenine deaminase
VLAIDMTERILLGKRRDVVLRAGNGVVLPDTDQDVLYVTVVERYGKTNNRPVAFISGFGLKSGAMATSTAPDDNNIVCVGTTSEDMALAINRIAEAGGGQAVAVDGQVIEFLELPVGGIVADLEPEEMARREQRLEAAARRLGCALDRASMHMSFLPITAIPEYAMTDVGAIDVVNRRRFEPVLGEVRECPGCRRSSKECPRPSCTCISKAPWSPSSSSSWLPATASSFPTARQERLHHRLATRAG